MYQKMNKALQMQLVHTMCRVYSILFASSVRQIIICFVLP